MLSIPLECAAPTRPAAPPHTILIVDDDEVLADVLSMRLGRQGFDTTTADNGQRALELARSQRPSVILLDLRLPDIDGFELCQMLVDDEVTCDIPVIIVSGLEQPDVIRRSRAAGCLYYVRKPYDPNALLILIRQAIEEAEQD
ncbi:MAG TPA: response regulator [Pirellulales bacterium]|nr:response regulator [Pirellulales bacterium]